MTPGVSFFNMAKFSMAIVLLLNSICASAGELELALVDAADVAPDPPIHIHLTWAQDDTSHTIAVTWQTSTSEAGDIVFYDIVSRGGEASQYEFSAVGQHHTYEGASGFIHDVELTGLKANTIYYFICGGEEGGYSQERGFRTAPESSLHITFVAGGDSRTLPDERDKVSEAMAPFDPMFVLYLGDAVETGGIQSEWDDWFSSMDTRWIGNNGLTIPIIPCLANHEYYGDTKVLKYLNQYALPGNEEWYSLNWGPDIHIIVLNSESPIDQLSGEQKAWLEADLAEHASCKWKFVIFHKSPYVSDLASRFAPGLHHWVPLFDKYHVDIVFTGHNHIYERSYPINATAADFMPQPSPATGTIYVVSGGWGAPLGPALSRWWTAHSAKRFNFVLVNIFPNGSLHVEAKSNQGNTFDEFWIHKPWGVETTVTHLIATQVTETATTRSTSAVTVTSSILTTIQVTTEVTVTSESLSWTTIAISASIIAGCVVIGLILGRRKRLPIEV